MTLKIWLSTYLMKELALNWDSCGFLGMGWIGNLVFGESQWRHTSTIQGKQGAKQITQIIPAKHLLEQFGWASVLYAISLFLWLSRVNSDAEMLCLLVYLPVFLGESLGTGHIRTRSCLLSWVIQSQGEMWSTNHGNISWQFLLIIKKQFYWGIRDLQ